MNAKTAGLVAIATSSGALAVLLFYLPAVVIKIQEINEQVRQDSREFQVLAQESWNKINVLYGPDIGLRIRRQASKIKTYHKARDYPANGGEYGSYGASPSGYDNAQYGKSIAQDICANPAMDAALEKAQQCGTYYWKTPVFLGCNVNRACPPGDPGPPGKIGLDGIPGAPGKRGKQGQPGNAPPVAITCDDEYADSFVASSSQDSYGKSRSKRGYGDALGYGVSGARSSYKSGGKNCCRVCPIGPVGPSGPPGSPGECGTKGYPGPLGKNAEDGRPGNSGSPGKPGEPGLTGKMGLPGSKGQDGTKGLKGPPGKKGKQGESGQKGPDGFAGKDGALGIDGSIGLTGPPGYVGDKGQDGKPGPAGLPGEPGQDAHYCPCPERGAGANNQNVQQENGYDQIPYSQPPAAPEGYSNQANSYGQQTQGSGYVQRAAHGAVLRSSENSPPNNIEPSSDIAKTSPYFSRLAKLKRLRQMAKKAKT